MRYRRSQVAGATYFFTVVTYRRKSIFHDINNIELLRDVFRYVKSRHSFQFDAFVLLPDHLHCIWTLPAEDKDYSARWMLIKSYFSRYCFSKIKIFQLPVEIAGVNNVFGKDVFGSIK